MAKPIANTEKVTIFLSKEIYDELKKEADTQGNSMSGLIRMIVHKHVNEKQQ